jgi:hypothetical protein
MGVGLVMSYKPRIFYYDSHNEKIISPSKANNLNVDSEHSRLFTLPNGKSSSLYQAYGDTFLHAMDHFTSLISTNKKDKNGNEIIDGHIIHQQFYDINNQPTHQGKGVVVWDDSTDDGMNCLGFRVIPIDYDNERHHISNTDNVRVVGHALTDPEMTPDSFDVEAYFND